MKESWGWGTVIQISRWNNMVRFIRMPFGRVKATQIDDVDISDGEIECVSWWILRWRSVLWISYACWKKSSNSCISWSLLLGLGLSGSVLESSELPLCRRNWKLKGLLQGLRKLLGIKWFWVVSSLGYQGVYKRVWGCICVGGTGSWKVCYRDCESYWGKMWFWVVSSGSRISSGSQWQGF